MNALWTLFRKEWHTLFSSPIHTVMIAVYAVLMGVLFFMGLVEFQTYVLQAGSMGAVVDPVSLQEGVIVPLYSNIFVLWLFLIPMVTMGLIAEERKRETFVLLATAPIRSLHIVLGKFMAGMAFVLCLLLLSAVYPFICIVFGNADLGPILSANLGLLLMGSSFVALGLLASSLTESPVLAAALGFAFILLAWLVGALSEVGDGWAMFGDLSLVRHVDPFMKGIVDTYDVAFYVLFTAGALFLSHEALQSERWR